MSKKMQDQPTDKGEVVIKGQQYEDQMVCLYNNCSWMVEDYSKEHGPKYCCIRLGQKFLVTPFTNLTFTRFVPLLFLLSHFFLLRIGFLF
jgi:hypothetical protein